MNRGSGGFRMRREQGFAVHLLRNDQVELAAVPELGGKIISLKNLRTGRDWMWHPAGGMRLFQNAFGDDFATSPLTGVDECLPTIAPCSWRGRQLPDHGELWTVPWEVDAEAGAQGVLKTRVQLRVSPLVFHRTVELNATEVRLSYCLESRSQFEEPYLWAIHPLLRLQPGDRLELPASTRALLNGEPCNASTLQPFNASTLPWVPEGGCAKAFARPLNEGWARIVNQETGEYLGFKWDPGQNPVLGLWLTCGGWHGHHHFALEPTNGDHDALTVAASRKHCGLLPAGGSAAWQVRLRLGPQ